MASLAGMVKAQLLVKWAQDRGYATSWQPQQERTRDEHQYKLYIDDFYTWTQTTAAAIRAGKWQDLDAAMIAEEIESLGISQEHALRSHLKQLLMHLLKWQYQPSAADGALLGQHDRQCAE